MMLGFVRLVAAFMFCGLAVEARAQCVPPTHSTAGWVVARSPRLPGVRLRLPSTLRRDVAEDTVRLYPQPHGSRWVDSSRTQISVFQVDSSARLFTALPTATGGRTEFSRCESIIAGGRLTVVAYNKREDVGDLAFVGPFQVFAEYRAGSGVLIQVAGSSQSREGFEQLRAAAYTLRVRPSLRLLADRP